MTAKQDVERLHGMAKDDPGFLPKPSFMPRGWGTKRRVTILVIDDARYVINSGLMARRVAAVLAHASIYGHQRMPSTQTRPQIRPGKRPPTQENNDGKTS